MMLPYVVRSQLAPLKIQHLPPARGRMYTRGRMYSSRAMAFSLVLQLHHLQLLSQQALLVEREVSDSNLQTLCPDRAELSVQAIAFSSPQLRGAGCFQWIVAFRAQS